MQYGYCHRTIGKGGKKGHRPVCTVSSTNGYLVSFLNAAIFKQDVQLLYLSCNIVILQGYSFIICQGIAVPVVFDAVLYIRVKTLDAFHCTNLILLCKGNLFFAHSKMFCALFWVCVTFSCFCCWLLQITCWS